MDGGTALSTMPNRVSEHSLKKSTISSDSTRLWIIDLRSSAKPTCCMRGWNWINQRQVDRIEELSSAVYKRSGREMFSKTFHGTTKKEKRSKKESLWKLPQPWKSQKVAFGDVFLMISTAAW